jgi:hypothetical protein
MDTIKDNFNLSIIDIFNIDHLSFLKQKFEANKKIFPTFFVGLDTEWYDDNIALIQLSFYNDLSLIKGEVFLIRLYDAEMNFYNKIPRELIDILIDQNIIKVGVDIANDIYHIMNDFDFGNNNQQHIQQLFVKSSFDLQNYHKNKHNEKDKKGLMYLSQLCV